VPTTAEQLAEAQAAYHALMTGKSARVVVDQNGERVEFTAINAERLLAYIETLKLTSPSRGPLRPYF
jgi:gpW